MKDLGTKQKVLKEIMDLMDSRDGDKLKSHPKLIAAKVEVAKPEDGIKKMLEGSSDEEASETPAIEAKEGDSEISPEMLDKLLAHFKGL